MTNDPTLDRAVRITSLHWDFVMEMRMKLNASADGMTMMEFLDEDICGYCGTVKKRGEWCDNPRCDSQLRRKRD